MKGKKIYIAGKITGFDGYKEKFAEAEKRLVEMGAIPMNPAVLSKGFKQEEYLKICFVMINVCDAVYLLNNWTDSPGARAERAHALRKGKKIYYEPDIRHKKKIVK